MAEALSAELLVRVLGRVLEEAAFVFTELAPPTAAAPADELVWAELAFQGPHSGQLHLAVSAEFGRELAANLLGTDQDASDAGAGRWDAVGEILNMVGGVLTEAWFGADAASDLGTPVVCTLPATGLAARIGQAVCQVTLLAEDEHLVYAAVALAVAQRGDHDQSPDRR